jgi:hypothetical protein
MCCRSRKPTLSVSGAGRQTRESAALLTADTFCACRVLFQWLPHALAAASGVPSPSPPVRCPSPLPRSARPGPLPAASSAVIAPTTCGVLAVGLRSSAADEGQAPGRRRCFGVGRSPSAAPSWGAALERRWPDRLELISPPAYLPPAAPVLPAAQARQRDRIGGSSSPFPVPSPWLRAAPGGGAVLHRGCAAGQRTAEHRQASSGRSGAGGWAGAVGGAQDLHDGE